MSFDIKTEKGLTILTCHGELTIVEIADFQKTIIAILPVAKEVVVDLSDIVDMDLSCLQLLCSSNMSFEKNKKKFTCKEKHNDIIKQTLLESGYNKNGTCPENPCRKCFWKGGGE